LGGGGGCVWEMGVKMEERKLSPTISFDRKVFFMITIDPEIRTEETIRRYPPQDIHTSSHWSKREWDSQSHTIITLLQHHIQWGVDCSFLVVGVSLDSR